MPITPVMMLPTASLSSTTSRFDWGFLQDDAPSRTAHSAEPPCRCLKGPLSAFRSTHAMHSSRTF